MDSLLTQEEKEQSLSAINSLISTCKKCKLCETRTNVVCGSGNPNSPVVFIGEAPGKDEDLQGLPFVGRAGKKLNEMLSQAGFKREEVFILNIIKCRPPENRNPDPIEIQKCNYYLMNQLEIITPKIIITLGAFAAKTLLGSEETIGNLRSINPHFYYPPYKNSNSAIQLIATYHPAYILRNPVAQETTVKDITQAHLYLKKD